MIKTNVGLLTKLSLPDPSTIYLTNSVLPAPKSPDKRILSPSFMIFPIHIPRFFVSFIEFEMIVFSKVSLSVVIGLKLLFSKMVKTF